MSMKSDWRNPESSRGGASKWRGFRTKSQGPESTPPRRKMEYIASVSRSSGLEKDGDALKDFGVQDEYREFIQGKLDDIWKKYPRKQTETETESPQRIDAQENVLILFRKLREGIISSKRVGKFTLEAYETSLFLAVLFDSPRHISPVIPALMSYIHLPSTEPHRHCNQTILVCLLQHLVAAYPSQREFHSYLASVPDAFLPDGSPARIWVTSLARCLRARNYAKMDKLTQLSSLPTNELAGSSPDPNQKLSRKTLYHLVDSLRKKAREMTWSVMRSAYRELSCQVDPDVDTRSWLERSLGLLSNIPEVCNVNLDHWLEAENSLGHVRRKEGIDGRWIVCKPR
ncbi:hypothetical protein C8R43DRAFT_567934 [Mycena crocata]|nr:hypothetical protein C8R43DRAFT_567934 [Mycena crocata]